MATFDALIFDCDGVLVDSEVLAQEVELKALASIGLNYPRDDFTQRFTGTSAEDMNAAVAADYEANFGQPIPPSFFDELGAAIEQAYRQHLQPIPGAIELAQTWSSAKAVASSSSADMVALKLNKVGLTDCFHPHIFTAEHGRAKPHPDLFQLAAASLEIDSSRCVVIEDSVNGVLAACRAGMHVIGLHAGGHCLAGHDALLAASGADRVCGSFDEVAAYLEQLQL